MAFNDFLKKKIVKGVSEVELVKKINEYIDKWDIASPVKYVPEAFEPFQILMKYREN